MSAEIAKVLARVKKLLALGNNEAASEGERDNALRMAHATLAKYNLNMAQVEAVGNVLDNDPRVKEEFDCKAEEDWTMHAAAGIAKLFFCFYYRNERGNGGGKVHVFIGKSVNVMTAQYMSEYVINSIKREAEKGAKEHYGEAKLNRLLDFDDFKEPEATKPVWTLAFCAAAAVKVRERCNQLAEAAKEQRPDGVPGTALVLASVYQQEHDRNVAMLKELGIHLQTRSLNMGRNVGSARHAGASFGSRINLSQQIGSGSAVKRLK